MERPWRTHNRILSIVCLLSLIWPALNAATIPVTIVAVPQTPFVVYDSTKTGNAQFSGVIIDVIAAIFAKMSTTTGNSYVPTYYLNTGYGAQRPDGSFSGAVGEVAAGRANLTAAALSVTASRLTAISFSIPFTSSGIALLVRKFERKESMWMFLKPFSTGLWLLVLAFVVVSAFGVNYLDMRSPYGSWNRIYEHDDAEDVLEEQSEQQLRNTMYDAARTLLEKEVEPPRALSSRIMMMAMFFAIMFVHASYEAGLNGVEIGAQLETGIQSYLDIQSNGLIFGVAANSSVSSFFLYNPSFNLRRMSQNMYEYDSLDDAVKDLREANIDGVFGSTQIMQTYASQAPCEVTLVDKPLSLAFWSFGMQQSAVGGSFQTAFNAALMSQLESQYVSEAMTHGLEAGAACEATFSANSGADEGSGKLFDKSSVDARSQPLDRYAGVFIIFTVMLAVSWLFLGVEHIAFAMKDSPVMLWWGVNIFFGWHYAGDLEHAEKSIHGGHGHGHGHGHGDSHAAGKESGHAGLHARHSLASPHAGAVVAVNAAASEAAASHNHVESDAALGNQVVANPILRAGTGASIATDAAASATTKSSRDAADEEHAAPHAEGKRRKSKDSKRRSKAKEAQLDNDDDGSD